jgi:tRNA threonylcarbamoyladenosine biosynthesis protein TsaE
LAFDALLAAPAGAHPHSWIDVTVQAFFDDEGRFAAVREYWVIDVDESLLLRALSDENDDRELDEAENAEFVRSMVEWLTKEDYFTRVTVAGREVETEAVDDLAIGFRDDQLRLGFTVRLAEETFVTLGAGVDVFDEEYYYEMSFAGPPEGVDAPAACTVSDRHDDNIDPFAAMLLRKLGLDAGSPALADPAAGYSTRVAIECPAGAVAAQAAR